MPSTKNSEIQIFRGVKTTLIDGRRYRVRDKNTISELNQSPTVSVRKITRFLWSAVIVQELFTNKAAQPFQLLLDKNVSVFFIVVIAINFLLLWLSYPYAKIPPISGWSFFCSILILVFSLFFHELGHVAASLRYGIRADHIGIGVYIAFPAFYTTVSLANLLTEPEKRVLYIAGSYFQAILNVFIFIFYFILEIEIFRYAAYANIFIIIVNMIPFFNFDGHLYALSITKENFSEKLFQRFNLSLKLSGLGVFIVLFYMSFTIIYDMILHLIHTGNIEFDMSRLSAVLLIIVVLKNLVIFLTSRYAKQR